MPALTQKQLNLIGTFVLLVGCSIGGLVYWTGVTPKADESDEGQTSDLLTPDNSKTALRDAEMYGGKMALWTYHLKNAWNEWKHPKPIGMTMAASSGLVALLIFFAAYQRRPE
jgi:hypothetical protein